MARSTNDSDLLQAVKDLGLFFDFVDEWPDGCDASHKRAAAIFALRGLSKFLQDAIGRISPTLTHLRSELDNVSLGHTSDLFTPAPNGGRPHHTHQTTRVMATAAAALKLHQQAGLPKEEAANKIARALAKAGFKKQGTGKYGGAPDGKTVMGWQKRFAREARTAGSSWYVSMLKIGADQDRIEERARGVLGTAVFLVEMKDLADLID